ncbi:MAG: hypothetical protein HYS39_02290 [Proteobacteria bacterium]|nr:hypothetical protein [Pseudomonadota bacterium]
MQKPLGHLDAEYMTASFIIPYPDLLFILSLLIHWRPYMTKPLTARS